MCFPLKQDTCLPVLLNNEHVHFGSSWIWADGVMALG